MRCFISQRISQKPTVCYVQADFFRGSAQRRNISVSTSLDGFRELHNRNRPYISGEGTFDDVIRGIEIIRSRGIRLGAIETTTRHSLSEPEKLVDTYYDLGFRDIFIRPLTPLGCANKSWEQIGYLREIHRFIYFSQQMVFRHEVVYADYFTLASFFWLSVQHFITPFYYTIFT